MVQNTIVLTFMILVKEDTTHPVWSRPNLKHAASNGLVSILNQIQYHPQQGWSLFLQITLRRCTWRYAKKIQLGSSGNCADSHSRRGQTTSASGNGTERSNNDAKRPARSFTSALAVHHGSIVFFDMSNIVTPSDRKSCANGRCASSTEQYLDGGPGSAALG
jgi:hypothetical protein